MPAILKTKDEDHAISNARGWYSSICELVAALEVDYDRLHELDDQRPDLDDDEKEEYAELNAAATYEGEIQPDRDTVSERIQEGPLSLEVRGDWHTPGENEGRMPTEFNILLSTGGPALRIRGELDEHCQPSRAWLEYQDWGTPWTQYFDADQDTLLTYCQQFYFGE